MASDVVYAFLEDQEDLAAHIRADLYVVLEARRVESKFYAARTQGLRREASHPLRQVAKMIPVRVDRPDDVAHRVNRPPRHGGDQRKPLADLWITRRRLLSQYIAEAGDQ